MKNYLVKVLFDFNDTMEKDKDGNDTPRTKNDTFCCTKERYEFLKSKNAVMLMGIDEIKEEKPKKTKKTNKK